MLNDAYEYGEEPDWRGEEESNELIQLLEKCDLQCTSFKLLVPFTHDPSKSYVGGKIHQDAGHYWRIEGQSQKFKSSAEAVTYLLETIELKRHQMLNEEFRNSGI